MSTVQRIPNRASLEELYDPITGDLAEIDGVLHETLDSEYEYVAQLVSRVRRYQGKKIRPALLLLSAKATGETRSEHHILGAVIEMIHVATLVHDDMLDEADTRRHVPTVHAEWGLEAGVLLGDYLFSKAYHLAATLDTVDGCRLIGEATNRTCEGELRQISRRGHFDLSIDEYIEIVAGKTAELIACACHLGAKFAGAEPAVCEAMFRYGRNLGIAFQIADDILDLVGEPSATGKSIGTDWQKRKMTLPLIYWRDRGPDEARILRSHFEDSKDRRREILAWLDASGVLEKSQETAEAYAEKASRELDLLVESPCRDRLAQIARFSARRAF